MFREETVILFKENYCSLSHFVILFFLFVVEKKKTVTEHEILVFVIMCNNDIKCKYILNVYNDTFVSRKPF